ncbi:phage holin [Oceanobacillus sojae]|uniref:phage holin n=1 Tax=Oceanobacillus sojae TaxID=582851 RepID=UPI00098894BB|nr:phage holin [Oceanobacillus sojae]MCT1904667.1 SPP1 phage holin family protein [Oceanobacillus sojae]
MSENLARINNKWVRLTVLVIVFINTAAMLFGYRIIPLSNEDLVSVLSLIALLVSEIWNHWKNNSYTPSAKEADKLMKKLKR